RGSSYGDPHHPVSISVLLLQQDTIVSRLHRGGHVLDRLAVIHQDLEHLALSHQRQLHDRASRVRGARNAAQIELFVRLQGTHSPSRANWASREAKAST